MEKIVTNLRQKHPAWGGRKLEKRLLDLGQAGVPSPSTITAILQRHQLLDPKESAKHQAFLRFERAAPNELWQMDFKGEFKLPQGRCYPLTILDDHSRFAVALQACARNTRNITQTALIQVFRRYGLPARITCDNGSPWGSRGRGYYTGLGVWLMRLGVAVSHSRPHHPQTQGKDERFHRSLKVEVLAQRIFGDFEPMQIRFDEWRYCYNHVRPHEALDMNVPASRYQVSQRSFPEQLPPLEYGAIDQVRKVQIDGSISFRHREFRVGKAFRGYPVALRPTVADGVYEIYFATHRILTIDLRQPN